MPCFENYVDPDQPSSQKPTDQDIQFYTLPLIQPLKVSMIRKYHNYTLQTNPWQLEEEPQNITITKHLYDNKSKATRFLFLFKMIAKLEWTQSYA